MLLHPDVGPTHIVFRYTNDLWLVPNEGGIAVPLASPPNRARIGANRAYVAEKTGGRVRGDYFPNWFRKAGVGKLVGTRTWGGLVGLGRAPTLIDGGWMSAPSFALDELRTNPFRPVPHPPYPDRTGMGLKAEDR